MIQEETIAAISTPLGEGAIAIVRLTGRRSIAIADKIFQGKTPLDQVPSHTIHHGKIVHPLSDQVLDEVLISLMRAPASYTAEDVVEINCHGGLLVTRKILELTLRCGARLARPGEFTRRAFLNGRLDLVQAEAVVDVIRSKAERSLRLAQKQLAGGLSDEIGKIRKAIVEALALVEAELDFSDQDLDGRQPVEAQLALEGAERAISGLLRGARLGRQLREGFTVVIVGRPNVGKSSLFNALLRDSRAIVTSLPGTTRDTISEDIELQGVPLCLVDTAGLHASQGIVEQEGVRRTRSQMGSADLLLVLLDGSEALQEEDRDILRETERQRNLIIVNKMDLPQALDCRELRKRCPSRNTLGASAKLGHGVPDVATAILKEIFNGHDGDATEPLVSRMRHREALKASEKKTSRARRLLSRGANAELVAVDLREAISALGEITGETYTDEALERIFDQFCVGK